MTDLYEAHVTVDKPASAEVRDVLETLAAIQHWKTSEIDGDPVLGKKLYFYFTSHQDTYDGLMTRVCFLVKCIRSYGIKVVREKIEKIVHDVRY